jgi:hypothetical protein
LLENANAFIKQPAIMPKMVTQTSTIRLDLVPETASRQRLHPFPQAAGCRASVAVDTVIAANSITCHPGGCFRKVESMVSPASTIRAGAPWGRRCRQ